METLRRDLGFAIRSLRRRPGFTAAAVLTLALGIGATTAIFSVVHAVLLRPLPYPDPHRLVQVSQVAPNGARGQSFSYPNFEDLRDGGRSLETFAAYSVSNSAVYADGVAERVGLAIVSPAFFDVLGVRPLLGRAFLPEEAEQGQAVAVVSHGYWQRRLGARPELVDRTLAAHNRVFSIVGVLPPTVELPADAQVWIPREPPAAAPSRTAHGWRTIGRLHDGVALEHARQELSGLARQLRAEHGDDTWMADADLVPLHEQVVGQSRPALLVLLAGSGLLLLIAIANVINLLLARTAARQREIAVRVALGAGRARVAQQLLSESLVLAAAGGIAGALLAALAVRALPAIESGRLPRVGGIGVDPTVLLFALGVSLLAALAMGGLAALRASRTGLRDALTDGRRTQGGAATHRTGNALTVAQVALTLVLLVGAGLLGRSFLDILALDPGYRTDATPLLNVTLPWPETPEGGHRLVQFHDDLLARIAALPGVERAGGVNDLPLTGSSTNGMFLLQHTPDEITGFEDFRRVAADPARQGFADWRIASGGYFPAMGIPLVRGRLFDDRDSPDAPHVALVSESLAQAHWPGEDALGKLIQFGNMDGDPRPFTIIGVVGDVRENLTTEPRSTFYAHYRQRPKFAHRFHVVMHGSVDAGAVAAAARRIAYELDPQVPATINTLDGILSASLADRRFNLLLLGAFAITALLLSVLGIYSVIAYLVTQRTGEIGIRMALGARAADVLRMVLRRGATLAAAGIAIGFVIALAATRVLTGMVHGVSVTDPLTFAAVPLVLVGVALLASYVPARRAARVDPTTALRSE